MNKLISIIADMEFDRLLEAREKLEASKVFLQALDSLKDTEIPDNVIQIDFINKKRLG